ELDERDDLLPPPLARSPHHDHVVHRGVAGDGRLHLLGEDLLATGVDRDRVAAEQLDLAARQVAGPVARHRVAHAVDHREGPGGLGGVLVVAERDPARLREPPVALVARWEHGIQVLGHDHAPGAGREPAAGALTVTRRQVAHLGTGQEPGTDRQLAISTSLVDGWLIWASFSDDQTGRVTIACGMRSRIRSLIVGVSGAPPLSKLMSKLSS